MLDGYDSYFEREDVTLSYPEESTDIRQLSTGLSNVVVHSDNESPPIVSVVKVTEASCLAIKDGPKVILPSLIQVGLNQQKWLAIYVSLSPPPCSIC